jgi:hypothetical protein
MIPGDQPSGSGRRSLPWTGLAVGSAVLAVVIGIAATIGVTRPTVYELSNGYRGWVRISYEDPMCRRPLARGINQTVRVDNEGRGCSSGALPKGWHYQAAEYVAADRTRSTAPSVCPLGHSDAKKLVVVFVGTEHEFRSSPEPPWLWTR